MPKKQNTKKRSRRAKPRFGLIDTPATHTFVTTLQPALASGGTSFQAFTWANFSGFATMADFYQYFVPLSYKIDLIGYQPSATTNFYAAALVPNDFATSFFSSAVPILSAVLAMKGRIEIMPNAMNHGAWVKWPQPQPALGAYDAASTPQNAGTLYVNGTGTAGTPIVGTFVVSVNCKFFKRVPYQPGLSPTITNQQQVVETDHDEDYFNNSITTHKPVELIKGVLTAQGWVVEKNPGPDEGSDLQEPE